MTGNQIINSIVEVLIPKLTTMFNRRTTEEGKVKKRWERDYELDSFHGLYEGKLS